MKTRKKNMEHSFNIAVAMEYGILEAVIIRNFQYWISKNKANKAHFVNNHYWTYNSYDALVELFPYATKDQIKKRILRLVEKGVLIIGHFSEDSRDRTNWFAFADEARWIERNGTTNDAEKTDAECESARCIYTNNKHTNNKPNNIPPYPPKGGEREKYEKVFDGLSTEWVDLLMEWLCYKKERKESYKSERSLKAMAKQLLQLSNNDIAIARRIVEQSMANNWAGLFQLKENNATQQPPRGRDLIGNDDEFITDNTYRQ